MHDNKSNASICFMVDTKCHGKNNLCDDPYQCLNHLRTYHEETYPKYSVQHISRWRWSVTSEHKFTLRLTKLLISVSYVVLVLVFLCSDCSNLCFLIQLLSHFSYCSGCPQYRLFEIKASSYLLSFLSQNISPCGPSVHIVF